MKRLVFILILTLIPILRAADEWGLGTADTTIKLKREGDQVAVNSLAVASGDLEWIGGRRVAISLPERVFINREARPLTWKFTGAAQGDGSVILKFQSLDPALRAESIWEAHPGPGPIEHHVTIRNEGNAALELSLWPSLDLVLSATKGHTLENWWVEKGSGRPTDFGAHREAIEVGYRFTGHSTPYAEVPEMIPWLCIHDGIGQAGVYFGIEFSGRVGYALHAVGQPVQLSVSAGLDPADRNFVSRLHPQQEFASPTVFVGCYRGEVDDGANRLHRFVENHLRPRTADQRFPFVVNNSWGSGMAVDEPLARHMIDDAAALGVELFHIDAGWFRGVGDWYPDRKKFPQGLHPVSAYAHEKGLLFGLWVGWTQGGTDARDVGTLAVTNPEQREWFARDYPAGWHPAEFTGATVCLGAEPARAWCVKELERIVTEYQLDLLEHDQMMVVDECVRTNHDHTASSTDIAYHSARGYYSVYDQLRRDHPQLLFEDCVNGGRTVDFGIVRRTHYISITDTYDPLSNRRAFFDASYPLPPSMCECYVENKTGPTLGTFKAMLRSGMMGWLTLMCDTGAWSAEQHAAARRQIEIYKTWIRPLINKGDLYHISARPAEARWDGMEYFDDRTGKGVVFVFRGAKADEKSHSYQLKGLEKSASYSVWSEDGALARHTRAGEELMARGLTLELGEPGTSEIVYLQRDSNGSRR